MGRRRGMAPSYTAAQGSCAYQPPRSVSARLARLGRVLARALAALQHPLDHARGEDHQRERRDQDEAGVRDHLVVRLAPPALAAVMGQRGRVPRRPAAPGSGGMPTARSDASPPPYHGLVAVVIASDLAKDMAGSPLLRGVSFKLERRDRMTLSGRNGSGKTTLLRMLAGESSVDGGQLAFAKATRVALHDQRPPRDRNLSLRDYVLGGCRDLLALEARARRARARDGRRRDRRARRSRPTRRPRRGWSTRAATTGATASRRRCTGSASASSTWTATSPASRAASSRAPRWRGRWPATRTCCCSTSRPTTSTSPRWSGWRSTCSRSTPRSCSSPTTAGSSRRSAPRCSSSRAAARSYFKGTWHAWRREKAARDLALGRAIEKQEAEIARLERFVTRFRAGTRARQAQSRVKQLGQDRPARRTTRATARRSASRSSRPSARAGSCSSSRTASCAWVGASCCTTPSCGSSAASTSRSSARTARARPR